MRVAVVGGGIGGLTAARALVAAGFDAHVLEASQRCGGVVGTSHVDGFVREHAASSFLGGPANGALGLCEQLGLPVEKASPQAKRRWIYLDGKLRELPRDPIALVRTDLLTWRGKLALLREPFAGKRKPGEDESVHAFAARRFGAEAARAIVAPFVTGVFAADSHDISLEAGFPRFAALEDAGGLVRGMLSQMLRRNRGPSTPRGLYAPKGGVGVIAEALARELGARVHCGRRVSAVGPGVMIDGERWDGAVLALPADLAGSLVVDAIPELATRLDPFYRAPIAVVYLGYPEAAVSKDALDGFGFLVAQGEDLRVLGCVFESTVWPERAPAGHVLLRCILGGGRDPDAASLGERDLLEVVRHDLDIALGITAEPVHASVIGWERGIAQYQVGHKDQVRAAAALARTHRIALAGSDFRGAGLNDLCADAAAIVDEVRSW
jgi:oxygen-dependent protoporphyrinogen oxidase